VAAVLAQPVAFAVTFGAPAQPALGKKLTV
jgi:hypothetical protein